jgi:uncharacterized protein YceK
MLNFCCKESLVTVLLLVLVSLSGCATIITTAFAPGDRRLDGPNRPAFPWVYSGTFLDYHCFWHPQSRETNNVELFCLIDLPLSAVADTLILPVTIPLDSSRKKEADQQSAMQAPDRIANTSKQQSLTIGSGNEEQAAADYISGDSNQAGIHEARTYCPNADRGNANAQMYIGDMHYLGAYKLKRDPVRAWVWYSLAAQKGDALATEQLSKVTAELTPEQLEEAKRQLEAWQPGQCMQELTGDENEQEVK